MTRSLIVVPLFLVFLISCRLASANYGVLDIFSSDADCATLGPVQASIRREVGVCWNVPPEFSHMFSHPTIFDNKRVDDDVPPVTPPPAVQNLPYKSYRVESCLNTSPFLSASVSVFEQSDCDGIAKTIDMTDILPSTCVGSMRMSCQESPIALEENWPSVELWFPTTDVVEPDCSPSNHPPVVVSYHPECALFNERRMALHADCSEDGSMALHLYEGVDACPTPSSDITPFWSVETSVDVCQLAGDVFSYSLSDEMADFCESCIANFAMMEEYHRVDWEDFMARTSVKFRCF